MRVILHLIILFFTVCSYAIAPVPRDLGTSSEQPAIDFLTAEVYLSIDTPAKKVSGTVTYVFKTLDTLSSFYIDAQKMDIGTVLLDDKEVLIKYDQKKLQITKNFKAGTTHSLKITYQTKPSKAIYFVKDYQGNDQIWTQGQGKYTSNWLPSFDDTNEKVIYDFTIDYEKDYEVIANGKLIKKEFVNDSIQRWQYDMKDPMSSYLIALVIGKYEKITETSKSGISLEMYYYPEDKNKIETTYRHSKKMFDFLEKEIGFSFPWQNYKQIPVKDFLYAGMENTGTTIFSDAFVVDSIAYTDRNYINVNAHELAHQWFGDLVTATEGTHHWLQEGFATYYALLAEKEIFGSEYFEYKLYESAEQLTELSKSDKATSLLNPKASSLTFYQRGAWALHALHNLIGDTHFRVTVHNYLESFKFNNADTSDFIQIAEEVSGTDLSVYRKTWLENIQFPSQQALDILTTSKFIKEYLNLAQQRTQPMAGKWGLLAKSLQFPVNDYIGQEVVYQLDGDTSQEAIALLDKAFETNNIYVRQTIANTVREIPSDLKSQFETLLGDQSYATVEPALYHLWLNFPEDRNKYLEKTKNSIGFNDKNVRVLWLVLALNTPTYEKDRHAFFYQELLGYTSPQNHFSTRENAFTYLESLKAFSDQALVNLVDGSLHHNWRFRKFCRNVLDNLLKQEKYQKKYVDLMNSLSQKQKEFLDKKLTP